MFSFIKFVILIVFHAAVDASIAFDAQNYGGYNSFLYGRGYSERVK